MRSADDRGGNPIWRQTGNDFDKRVVSLVAGDGMGSTLALEPPGEQRPKNLALRRPAIREQLDTIDIAGGVTGQESHGSANLMGLADTPDGAFLTQGLDHRLSVFREHMAQRRSIYRARAQEVDAHPAAFDIERPASDQRAQCRFGCTVYAQARAGIDGGGGADDDNAAALAHERQRALNGEGHALYVSAEYPIEIRFGDAAEWSDLAHTCVGYEHIDSAMAGFDSVKQHSEIGYHRDVRDHRAGSAPERR